MDFVKDESDFTTTPERALSEINPDWRNLEGLIIFGSHSPNRIEEKLEKIRHARENGIPTLGICLGLQLMVIEYARNVLKLPADSQENDSETPCPVIKSLPERRTGIYQVGGEYYSHWHGFAFNNDFLPQFNEWDITFDDRTGKIAEIMRLKKHPYFVGVQFHPEYQSTKEKPSRILKDFLLC